MRPAPPCGYETMEPMKKVEKVKKAAKEKDTAVVWLEIGGQSYIGNKMERLADELENVTYRSVSQISGVQAPLEELLIQYKK